MKSLSLAKSVSFILALCGLITISIVWSVGKTAPSYPLWKSIDGVVFALYVVSLLWENAILRRKRSGK